MKPKKEYLNWKIVHLSWLVFFGISMVLKPVSADDSQKIDFGFDVFTRESDVVVDGKKYRRIEYKNKNYYILLLAPEQKTIEILCDDLVLGGQGATKPLLSVEVKMVKRSSLLMEGLSAQCLETKSGQRKTIPVLDVNLKVQVGLNDSGPMKNQKIFFNLLRQSLGYSAEW